MAKEPSCRIFPDAPSLTLSLPSGGTLEALASNLFVDEGMVASYVWDAG